MRRGLDLRQSPVIAGFLLCMVAIATACQGRSVPLSAQAGSTMVIPIANAALNLVGYGGTLQPDHQRGTLIYQLGGPGGFELTTRATTAVTVLPGAKMSQIGVVLTPAVQAISLVDIPVDAPVGTHAIHVVRRRIENGTPVDYPGPAFLSEITILPHQIQAGGSTYTGQPTPLEGYVCAFGCSWADVGVDARNTIPRPQAQFNLSRPVHSVELRVTYPSAVIDVVDAYEPVWMMTKMNHRAVVWWTDDGAGTLYINAAAQGAAFQFQSLAFAFELDDGESAVLDPAALGVTVLRAGDQNGVPVTAAANVYGIR